MTQAGALVELLGDVLLDPPPRTFGLLHPLVRQPVATREGGVGQDEMGVMQEAMAKE